MKVTLLLIYEKKRRREAYGISMLMHNHDILKIKPFFSFLILLNMHSGYHYYL